MKRLFIASNKLPVKIFQGSDGPSIESDGRGTIYGLEEFYEKFDAHWIGHTGLDDYEFSPEEELTLTDKLKELRCIPLFPELTDYQKSLHGFSKNTLWPLFHYFTENTTYNDDEWDSYVRINELYANKLCEILEDEDILWIHDFHLLLLSGMVQQKKPNVSIGLFIHIPFPSFEIFRLLPWRNEILDGILGADLVGFHVFDYVRHFMSSVRRLKGYDTTFNLISIDERTMKADVFPKGIDFDTFTSEVRQINSLNNIDKSAVQKQIETLFIKKKKRKIILSIDPLDYTKGIPQRLMAFEFFLQNYPSYLEKVSLVLLALPSGESTKSYNVIKKKVDELVGRINGLYGTIAWTPIIYLNQEFSINELITLYAFSDIALILPFRDGMNMVAKEFVASRLDGKGVLILSELAGASKELHEAILVNPNNLSEIADAICNAIEMPVAEQIMRNDVMTERLRRYTIERWANEFISSLNGVKKLQQINLTRKITESKITEIISDYRIAKKRILFLDYDGTLSWFKKNPEDAKPDKELYSILNNLTTDTNNTLVIISGRDKETLSRWFKKNDKIHFIAEHGVWLKEPGKKWNMMEQIDNEWKESILPLLEYYVDQTPKTFIEYKNFSLVWHYRMADPDLGIQRSWELKEQLRNLTANLNLEIMDGDKVLEIKYSGINKGKAAINKMTNNSYDFILAVGDDWTDEYTFDAMPAQAYTIKVGAKTTKASFYIYSVDHVRELLRRFTE
ncbi:MAG: bifunctional alpha,alpha-trehalose-phosphate synthase (UDP-forming)/trehalose-phosphatase [Bacteroidales bacterium]|nr:bifunctional alpha,alpha-trehalose-phosphate synthase (UDP-forming)/trehalose-phosphatase [Bacteroidales bacterium]